MTIPKRIAKARADYAAGDYENALIQAVIAVAATSKKRYPKLLDRERFVRFLQDDLYSKGLGNIRVLGGGMSVMWQRRPMALEEVLYRSVRNSLFHEGEFPDDVVLVDSAGLLIAYEADKVCISRGAIEAFVHIVMTAPENARLQWIAQ